MDEKKLLNSIFGGGYVDTDMFSDIDIDGRIRMPKPIARDVNHGYTKAEATMMVADGSMVQKALEVCNNEVTNQITKQLGDQIREYLDDYFEHLGAYQLLEDPSQISGANYIGLQEAIQFLGIPNKVNLVYDNQNYTASGGFLMPYYNDGAHAEFDIPGPDPFDGNLAAFTVVSTARGSFNLEDLRDTYTFEFRIAFETVPKYVDITFRMRYTDELRDYIPNITAMYEHIKNGRNNPGGMRL